MFQKSNQPCHRKQHSMKALLNICKSQIPLKLTLYGNITKRFNDFTMHEERTGGDVAIISPV
jgi:hypothetical protein